jgi:hypothetical protein
MLSQINRNLVGIIYGQSSIWWEAPMEGSVLSFLKAEWKVSDTGSAHWASSFNSQLFPILVYWRRTWFSPGTQVSSTNKTDRHDITEILLKMALNTIIPIEEEQISKCYWFDIMLEIKNLRKFLFHTMKMWLISKYWLQTR